jgi:hypothetical protein
MNKSDIITNTCLSEMLITGRGHWSLSLSLDTSLPFFKGGVADLIGLIPGWLGQPQ